MADDNARPDLGKPSASLSHFIKKRILIATDADYMRRAIIRFLSTETDFEVIGQATNGKEAFNLFRTLRPDAIVMDVQLPLIDGIQATNLVRNESSFIPIIGIASLNEKTIREQMLSAGANAFLEKTTIPENLVHLLFHFLSEKGK